MQINTGNCLLCKFLNEVLTDSVGGEYYRFNPKAIMVDENSPYFYSIKEVLGLDFMMSKVVSCQVHFKNDFNKALT